MFCHADSLAVRISCNFLCAASRLARIALICSSYLARASALIWALLALSLSTSTSHFLIWDSIIAKYSSFLLMVRLLCQVVGNALTQTAMERGSFNSRFDNASGNLPCMRCGPICASRRPPTDVQRVRGADS